MTQENIEFHQYANLFPMMGGRELEEFQWDIRQNGVREPVILFEGKILDGRNRYKAATALGKEVRFEQYQGDDALAFAISLISQENHRSPPITRVGEESTGHGKSGIVYWAECSLKKIASKEDFLSVADMQKGAA